MKKILLVTTFALSLGLVTGAQAGLSDIVSGALGLLGLGPGNPGDPCQGDPACKCRQAGGMWLSRTINGGPYGRDRNYFSDYHVDGCCNPPSLRCYCQIMGHGPNSQTPCCPPGQVLIDEVTGAVRN